MSRTCMRCQQNASTASGRLASAGGDFWTEFAAAIGYSGLAMMSLQFGLTARRHGWTGEQGYIGVQAAPTVRSPTGWSSPPG
jgi:hypothetical protein